MPLELSAGRPSGHAGGWRGVAWRRVPPGFLAVSLALHLACLAALLRWQPRSRPAPDEVAAVPLIFAPAERALLVPAAVPAEAASVAALAAPELPRLDAAPGLPALRALPMPTPRLHPVTARQKSGPEDMPANVPANAAGVPAGAAASVPAAPAATAAAAGPLVPPRPVAGMAENQPPEYPAASQRRGEQGRVMLRVAVSAAGAPVSVEVAVSSGAARLDGAAVMAVRGWRFVPASLSGAAVAAVAEVPVQFTLQR